MAQNQLPQDSMERMLEQGAGQDPQNNPLLKQAQGGGGSGGVITNPLKAVVSMGDPNAWTRELYGLPPEPVSGGKETKDSKNHSPLDMNKVGSKDKNVTPEHRKFFKKYQDEYTQFLDQKKKQAEDKKKQEEEDERKKKEEQQKKQQEEQNQGGGQGKQKQKLGQPRRKATTEQHPETKAGGAK